MAWIIKNLQARSPMILNILGGNSVRLASRGLPGDCATLRDEEIDSVDVQSAVNLRRCSLTPKEPQPKPEPIPEPEPVSDDKVAKAGTTPERVRRRSTKALKEE